MLAAVDGRTYRVVDSPIGALTLVWDVDAAALRGLYVHDQRDRAPDPVSGEPDDGASPELDDVARQLDEYFAGRRTAFDVAVEPEGTAFRRQVWAALREVPPGETTTYGALATAVGSPRAAQAVGTANARNPVSIVVPCHRVVTASGEPSGGGPGIRRKRWLLALERRLPAPAGSDDRGRRRIDQQFEFLRPDVGDSTDDP